MTAVLDRALTQTGFGKIEDGNPEVLWMLWKLRENTPAFRHQVFAPPQCWYGYKDALGVVAAFGWNGYEDGTIEIRYAVARPSKAGSLMLRMLAELFRDGLSNRVVFFSETRNRRMLRIAQTMGCTPIAVLWERNAKEGFDVPGRRTASSL